MWQRQNPTYHALRRLARHTFGLLIGLKVAIRTCISNAHEGPGERSNPGQRAHSAADLGQRISQVKTEKRCPVTHFRMLRREMDESCCRMSETIGANWSAPLWEFCCVELLLGLRSALLRQ